MDISPGTKEYGILSVVFQLYAKPRVNATRFPDGLLPAAEAVDSALVTIDLSCRRAGLWRQCLSTRSPARNHRGVPAAPQNAPPEPQRDSQRLKPGAARRVGHEETGKRSREPSEFLRPNGAYFRGQSRRGSPRQTRVWRHARHGGVLCSSCAS